MPEGGTRTRLDVSYSWGQQGLEARFAPVFQPGQGIFSPGYPLAPPEPERVRLWDFPVGVNTIYTPRSYEPVSFAELRALAEAHDITRLAIETRKDQLEKLDWTIKPRGQKQPTADTRARCDHIARFWRRPDGERPFATWLRELLEDLLVIDAPTLELRHNRAGEIIGLDVVDGATIKLLVDETGRRPKPPAPAYEQVIHGRPWKLLSSDQLLYWPRNPRPHKAYGFSPVEQIVMTVNIGLRRQVMQLQHFTEGNVPPGLINAPDGWNAEQIRQFQEWFDSVLAGNIGGRTRLVWAPGGAKYQAFKEAPYKDEFDEWVARIVCYAFSLPSTPFIRQMNRATADTAQEAALAEGLAPLMGWVKRLADHVIQDRMGAADLEFAWSDLRTIEPKEQAEILAIYVKEGIKTRNEARGLLGDDPLPGGDSLTVDTTQGPMPLAPQRTGVAAPVAKASFDPDQPRIPAGSPDGGQWTGDGGANSDGNGSNRNATNALSDQGISIRISTDSGGSDGDSAEDTSAGEAGSESTYATSGEGSDQGGNSSLSGARVISGLASWYELVGHRMSNGKMFDAHAMNAAMLDVPFGTMVTVELDDDPSRSIQVTVTDRGPYAIGRVIDLTRTAFRALVGNTDVGLARVRVIVPVPSRR